MCIRDSQVLSVGRTDEEHLQGLEVRDLMIGFSTSGACYNLGTHMKKDGPAASWAFHNRRALTEGKSVGYGETVSVGDVVTCTLVDGTIRYAINDRDMGQAFKLDGRDLSVMVHPTVACKGLAVRVRLDPVPLWPEVAIQFALHRGDPELGAQALSSSETEGHPEERVKKAHLDSLALNVTSAMAQFTEHPGFMMNAAQFVRRYARCSTQNQSTLIGLDAVKILAEGMVAHRTVPEVLASLIPACWTIAVNNPEGQVCLSEEGIPHLINTAMYNHSGSMVLQRVCTSGILPWVLRQVPAAASPIKSPTRTPPPIEKHQEDGGCCDPDTISPQSSA
eukprot:TRINITY_DN54582_c0_g1_i2.p1 TRINITY_DN54582_c0_g1~~TRINITY_DN54582_c0_g1_i2.p1  ORF type:complete len:335 (+),score=73.61 TRINITY_DN54582_c0_g1_i2:138-1142(+)